MRAFLDSILSFIQTATLTDEEYEVIEDTIAETTTHSKEVYLVLRDMLLTRDSVSEDVQWLYKYFEARGIDLSDGPTNPEPNSNIFIGSAL